MNQFDELLSGYDKKLRDAQEERTEISRAIGALDRLAPAPDEVFRHGYCADISLHFNVDDKSVDLLLNAYPPEPVVQMPNGGLTHKPLSYLREEKSHTAVLEVAPLLLRNNHGKQFLLWWTRLASGQMAQVHLHKATLAMFQRRVSAPQYRVESHTNPRGSTSFGVRELAEPQVRPGALLLWYQRWDAFASEQNYTKPQQQFLNAFRGQQLRPFKDLDWRNAGLPSQFSQPAESLDLDKPEIVRTQHWTSSIGDFWHHFDTISAEAFWTFCLDMRDQLQSALSAHDREVEEVRSALETIFSLGTPVDSLLDWDYVRHAVETATGLRPEIRIATRGRNASSTCSELAPISLWEFNIVLARLPEFAKLYGVAVAVDCAQMEASRVVVKVNATRYLRPQDIMVRYVD